MGYMSELLGLGVPDASTSHESKMPSTSSMHAKLVKADLNGALLTGERIQRTRLTLGFPFYAPP